MVGVFVLVAVGVMVGVLVAVGVRVGVKVFVGVGVGVAIVCNEVKSFVYELESAVPLRLSGVKVKFPKSAESSKLEPCRAV